MASTSSSSLPGLPPRLSRAPIVLIGTMGVGKSTVGRRLAQRLNLSFVDADVEIERAASCTISEIFDRHGEPSFRDGERRVIARLMREGRKVIATGGGAFINPETRALILQHGVAIWLDADIDTLVARVARRGHRPLLRDRDARTVLLEFAAKRNPLYALAPIRVESQNGPHENTVEAILVALRQFMAENSPSQRNAR